MQNYDIKTARRDLYAPKSARFEVVDIPEMPFLMADGNGNPNTSPVYATVVEALYTTAYAVRAIAKEELHRTHTVGPLEGLWSADDLRVFQTRDKDAWDWTLMIVQPEWISTDLATEAMERARKKRGPDAIDRVRFDTFNEGLSVQVLHVGSYDDEAPTIVRMHDEFIPAEGLTLRGRHHEIYLSDARRTGPSRLRTILRQPVRPVSE